MASFDEELPVVVVFDVDAEIFQQSDRHVDVRPAFEVVDRQGRVLCGQRQRHQQPGDELRTERTVDRNVAAADGSPDVDRQVASLRTDRRAELPQRFFHH